MGEVTELLQLARDGDASAWDRVVAIIYDDLKRIARGVLAGSGSMTLNPTSLVHDCYLRLSRGGADNVLNREHFLALAARAMRQLMLNHARDRIAAKRGGGAAHTTLGDVGAQPDLEADAQAEQLLALDAALSQLGVDDERLVRVVECRIFGGLSEEETAAALDTSLRSVQRLFGEARTRLTLLLAA